MAEVVVSAATQQQKSRAIDTLVLGFAANPTCRWFWPDAQTDLWAMPRLIEAMAGKAFSHQTAYVDQQVHGAALWLAPGIATDDDAISTLMADTIDPSRHAEIGAFFEKIGAFHPHDEPVCYLPLLAVDPYHQNQRLGETLMRYALEKNDAAGMTSYLESSDPKNVTLYERLGFEALGSIEVGSFKAVTPMIRRAPAAPPTN